jgi:dTDP-glucose 4,6-dehydratase
MKKVLVTGAAGFIGSHLCEHLVRSGLTVRAFTHYNSRNSWGWLESSPLLKEMEVRTGDIRDYDSVSKAMTGIDAVFHLGALIGIPYSYESPLAYLRTNVEGTYNVLESARRLETTRVLVTSTSEVYGTALYIPIDEKHPLQPQSPYSASKIGADNLALSYYLSFKTPVMIARPFNTFGPRQSARAIIPTIASQLLSGRDRISLGNLTPVRDLTYVEDTASGMLTIARTDAFLGRVINIGTGEAVSIQQLFDQLCEITGSRAQVAQSAERIRPDSSEVMRLVSDNRVLTQATDWKPSHTIRQGLEATVAWLQGNLNHYKPEIYNV